jgi:hypothetical protein
MKTKHFAICAIVLLGGVAVNLAAGEPGPNPPKAPSCDRACLTGIMDQYTAGLMKHDQASLPLAKTVRFTENTAQIHIGEGILWRANKIEPTAFKYYVADPVTGQVAIGALVKIQDKPALVAIRLKTEHGKIVEIEHLLDRNVNERALPQLQTPRPGLVNDVPADERVSRADMLLAADSYFNAIEGDSGKIGKFADDCERHENGIQTTVTKEPAVGMAGGAPSKLYMMTCSDQLDTKLFAYIHKIGPRRELIVDEQKGLVATFPLFVHDGTRRGAAPDAPVGMLINMVCLETFGVRGGKIHVVEAFPFVQIPYGLGDGWTPGSGR